MEYDFSQGEEYSKPYKHWIIPTFIHNCKEIRDAVAKEAFERKECDLFQFFQGKDFAKTENQTLKDIHTTFNSKEFLKKIGHLTNIPVTYIDMSPFIYTDTDYLLPHDDRLEDRKIAYVVSVGETRKKEEAGTFDMFKENKIVKRILPTEGQLLLFEVSKTSTHQVAECIGKKERITITGWFHG